MKTDPATQQPGERIYVRFPHKLLRRLSQLEGWQQSKYCYTVVQILDAAFQLADNPKDVKAVGHFLKVCGALETAEKQFAQQGTEVDFSAA